MAQRLAVGQPTSRDKKIMKLWIVTLFYFIKLFVKVYESQYAALFVVSKSIEKLLKVFSIDYAIFTFLKLVVNYIFSTVSSTD